VVVGVGTGTEVGVPVGVGVGVDPRVGGAVEARGVGDTAPGPGAEGTAPVELGDPLAGEAGVVDATAGRGWLPPSWMDMKGAVGPPSSATPSMPR
jgi:hypothetical protein